MKNSNIAGKLDLSLGDEQEDLTLDNREDLKTQVDEVVFITYNFKDLEIDLQQPVDGKINVADDKKVLNDPHNLTVFDELDIKKNTEEDSSFEIVKKSFNHSQQSTDEVEAEIIKAERGRRRSRYKKIFSSVKKGQSIKTISIPGWHVAGDVVFYEVVVSNKRLCWNCWIRFNAFAVLHFLLKDIVKYLEDDNSKIFLPPFPDKQIKMLKDHLSEDFIENRKALLENYLQKVNSDPTLRHAEDFISFLLPPLEEQLIPRNSHPALSSDSSNSLVEVKTSENPLELDELSIDSGKSYDSVVRVSKPRFLGRDQMLFVSDKDEITGVSVKSTTTLYENDGSMPHVIYHVHVSNLNKGTDFNVWIVMKRFFEFANFDGRLRAKLVETHPGAVSQMPRLPPKFSKSWTNHLNKVFIEKRRILLQVYLRRLIRLPLFRRHLITLEFFGVKSES